MEYRNLGSTGCKVSRLCLGTMQFGWTADEQTSFQVLSAAYEAGINFIDTADVYSRFVPGNQGGEAETIIGKWLKQSSIPRNRLVLATKVFNPMSTDPNDRGLSRVHILKSIDASLKRLQTDYVDLYQSHRPDPETPVEETMSAFDSLVKAGKVRYIGCSGFQGWQVVESLWAAQKLGLEPYASLQPGYNLVRRQEYEFDVEEVARRYRLAVIPYSPLAAGFLTGKYRPGQTEVESGRHSKAALNFTPFGWSVLEALDTVAAELGGVPISQVALAWVMRNPTITSPIIGPRSLTQLEDNLKSLTVSLSDEQYAYLNKVSDWKTA